MHTTRKDDFNSPTVQKAIEGLLVDCGARAEVVGAAAELEVYAQTLIKSKTPPDVY